MTAEKVVETAVETISPLDQALVDIINKTKDAVGNGVDFLSEQIPDVIHQLLLWKMAEAGVKTLAGLVIIVIAAFLLRKVWKETTEETTFFSSIAICLPGAYGVFMLENFMIVMKIWLAPKVYLIEYAAALIK